MLKSILNYVNYNYQFCENIDSPFLSNDEKPMNATSNHVWFTKIFMKFITEIMSLYLKSWLRWM